MQNQIIKEGALFIADAHFLDSDKKAFDFFDSLIQSPPVQVFFMGDIFHFLIGHIPTSLKEHLPLLQKINQLSQKTEVFYFEGNHDFAIPFSIFPKVKIYTRKLQPALFYFEDKKILLAHGDLFISFLYSFYISSMNTPLILALLKIIDKISFGFIYRIAKKMVIKKQISFLKNTNNFIQKRLQAYNNFSKQKHLDFDAVIEGHFHTTLKQYNYLAIPSFYCHKKTLWITKKTFCSLN
ncbi:MULTISPECIES: UDP-2,3-diacylglucosamine diphosphatase [unclassified Helicobacter]|uniref:UDP-2,3-diacylglucosamine diphosphatase n=1 Tax=unclassified Helicobacter TaxID=2593540 RepID=UPI000CF10750|nr:MULTISPECIES: metallophosphoesterase [unclassified Helicobacter]